MNSTTVDLKTLPIFKGVPNEVLGRITAHISVKRYAKNDVVCVMGESSSSLGLLLRGAVNVSIVTLAGREIGLDIVKAPASFGELSVIDGLPRSATLTAMSDCLVGWLPRQLILQTMSEVPQMSANFSLILARLVRSSNEQILLLSNHTAIQRICIFLLQKPFLVSGGDIQVIDLPSQREVANLTNTSRETVSRILSTLEDNGLIKRQGKKLIIVDRDEIEEIISRGND